MIPSGFGYFHRLMVKYRSYFTRVVNVMHHTVHDIKLAEKICGEFYSTIMYCAGNGLAVNACRDEVFNLWIKTKKGKKWQNTTSAAGWQQSTQAQ